MPVTTSGYSSPRTTIRVTTATIEVTNSLRTAMFRTPLVEVPGQALDDRSEQQGGKEGERPDQHDHADQQDDKGAIVGAHRSQAGWTHTLAHECTCDGQCEQDRRVASKQHGESAEQVCK